MDAVRWARLFQVGTPRPEAVDLDAGRPKLDRQRLLWVDLDPRAEESLAEVAQVLGLPEAIPAASEQPEPFVRFRDGALIVQVAAIVRTGADVRAVPLLLLAAPNLVLSIHRERIPGLEEPLEVFAADPRFGKLDAGTFVGLLLDGVVGGYFRAVEEVEQMIDELDTRALSEKDLEPLLDELVAVRRRIARLRRTIAPHRDVFAALTWPVAEPSDRADIGSPWPGLPDRLDRVLDATENAREQLVGTFDLVSTRTAEHGNDAMRILTVISAVLLPAVVIAGVMGMNFRVPLFDDPGNFLWVVALMALLAGSILGFARLRRWI